MGINQKIIVIHSSSILCTDSQWGELYDNPAALTVPNTSGEGKGWANSYTFGYQGNVIRRPYFRDYLFVN